MDHDELLYEQISAFDIAHLRSRVDVAGMPREHQAAAVGDQLEDAMLGLEIEGELMNEEERAVALGGNAAQDAHAEDDDFQV